MEQFLSQIESYLQSSILLALAASYLGGVLISLTPCLYPMIPITVGVIGSSNLNGSKPRGFLLTLSYVAGMALTYAALGLFAAATGRFFGTISTHPVTFIVTGNILLLFALSLLDVYHLPYIGKHYPTKMRGFPGVFLIGMTSGLIIGPCTAPVLGSLLAYVGSTGNLVLGGAMLFVFAIGMGTILLLVGTFTGILASIPRSGPWLVTIKKIIAVLILILAEYLFIQAGRMLL
ncbi:MAG: cytochrome c biogenesis protein CcdA [Desulfobulbaceae bacterium]|nr:cytochrome c biogenesis protein CcdA [Desulfobulbaceae bacterium]